MTSGGEHTALKRALAALGAVVALVVCVLAFARCSTPSTLHTGPVTVDPAQLLGPANATAAAMRAIEEWAPGTDPELVEAAWRGAGSDSMRVVALVEGYGRAGRGRARRQRLGGSPPTTPCRAAVGVVVVAAR